MKGSGSMVKFLTTFPSFGVDSSRVRRDDGPVSVDPSRLPRTHFPEIVSRSTVISFRETSRCVVELSGRFWSPMISVESTGFGSDLV